MHVYVAVTLSHLIKTPKKKNMEQREFRCAVRIVVLSSTQSSPPALKCRGTGPDGNDGYGLISQPNIMAWSSWDRLWQWVTYLPVNVRKLR
jgi:hypothetical protein